MGILAKRNLPLAVLRMLLFNAHYCSAHLNLKELA
jgi:hypothetical protein